MFRNMVYRIMSEKKESMTPADCAGMNPPQGHVKAHTRITKKSGPDGVKVKATCSGKKPAAPKKAKA